MEDKPCTNSQLLSRIVATEANLAALRQVLDERDARYAQRAASQDEAVRSALVTSEKAVTKAEAATEKRFDSVNEFRQTLADQAATLMPRIEYAVGHKAIVEKMEMAEGRISEIQKDLSSVSARGGGMKETWGYILAASSALATLIIYILSRGKL